MSEHRTFFRYCVGFIATVAVARRCFCAVFRAGCVIVGNIVCKTVSEHRAFFRYCVGFIATVAIARRGLCSVLGAGCLFARYIFCKAMTECFYVCVDITVAARTGIRCVALFGAGGSSYRSVVNVFVFLLFTCG